jgi:hypothetical protein
MNRRLRAVAGLSVLPVALAALSLSPAAGQDSQDRVSRSEGLSRSAVQTTVLAGEGTRQTLVAPPRTATALRSQAAAGGATFDVNYNGFTPAARRAFQAAVDLWAVRVSSSVPITVKATFEPLGRNVLGQAGPSFIWHDFAGAPQPKTWYVDAVANKRSGRQLSSAPDIIADFSSNQPNWYFGTDGRTPNGRYDFQSVVMHELGHGLGFLGAGSVNGDRGTVRTDRLPFGYDRLTENQAGEGLLGFPDNSTSLANQLTGNALYFDSAAVRNANRGARARLYAPRSWSNGSSYSHLNEGTYRQGNRNSLMTPIINDGEAIHSPGGITLAIFKGIGW